MAVKRDSLRRDVVVVGASAGGVIALRRLFEDLVDYPGRVAAVLHRSPFFASNLPAVLAGFRRTEQRIREPDDNETIRAGCIYVAPRDHHLLVDRGRFKLNRAAKEHHTRPAVDVLFRSAAACYGTRLIGVLLTGGGEDGTAGLTIIIATVVLRVIGLVNSPDLLNILTSGGPGSATQVLSLYAFQTAYNKFDFGYAGAMSVVMLLLLMAFTVIYVRVSGAAKE